MDLTPTVVALAVLHCGAPPAAEQQSGADADLARTIADLERRFA